jgi:ParB/RepB/Spo0J family partition protein
MTNNPNKEASTVTTAAPTQQVRIPTSTIDVIEGFNARDFDVDKPPADDPYYNQLKESIAAVGVRVPLTVRPNGDRYILVAGHRRLAAARAANIEQVPITYGVPDEESTDAAVENLVRSDLNVLEEARAIQQMIVGGMSEKGVAAAMGSTEGVIRNRLAILTLPTDAQALFGSPRHLSPRAVDALVALHRHGNEKWLANVVKQLADEQPGRTPDMGWMINRTAPADVWTTRLRMDDIVALRPNKNTKLALDALLKVRGLKHDWEIRSLNFDIGEIFVDQARAAGVLFEVKGAATVGYGPWITDKAWMKENLQPILRAELEASVAAKKASSTATTAKEKADLTPDELAKLEAKRAVRAELKELKRAADESNHELWVELLTKHSRIKTDLPFPVAQALVWGMIGSDPRSSQMSGQAKDSVLGKIAQCARVIVPVLRISVEQPPTKTGKPRPPKVELASWEDAVGWAMTFLQAPKESGELIGRFLVLVALTQHADKHAAPKRADEWWPVKLYGPGDLAGNLAGKAMSSLFKAAIPKSHLQVKAKIVRVQKRAQELGA